MFFDETVQCHDKPGRAKSALTSMAIYHSGLHFRERILAPDTFNSDHMTAVHLIDKRDARIDRLVVETIALAQRLAYQYRTSTTIPFGTGDLRTDKSLSVIFASIAEILSQRQSCLAATHNVARSIDIKDKVVSHTVIQTGCYGSPDEV